MGIDFHGVIETDQLNDNAFHNPIGFAYIEWARNRELFAKICTRFDDCLVPNRGYPNPASMLTLTNYGTEVISDGEHDHCEWGTMNETMALELLESGDCKTLEHSLLGGNWVNNPGNQHANWMTLTELESACTFVDQSDGRISAENFATIAAMRTLKSSERHCRLVYWFDV